MAIGVASLVATGLGMAKDWLDGRRKIKQSKVESKLKIHEAETAATIKLLETREANEVSWEKKALDTSGWKDEWFTIVLSIPLILCFIPGGAEYVSEGFTALNESTPDWYQYALLCAIAASFGVKKLTDFMRIKRGM